MVAGQALINYGPFDEIQVGRGGMGAWGAWGAWGPVNERPPRISSELGSRGTLSKMIS